MSEMFDLGRIKLQICVNNDRGSKKIPRAMMEKWGQLWDQFRYLHTSNSAGQRWAALPSAAQRCPALPSGAAQRWAALGSASSRYSDFKAALNRWAAVSAGQLLTLPKR